MKSSARLVSNPTHGPKLRDDESHVSEPQDRTQETLNTPKCPTPKARNPLAAWEQRLVIGRVSLIAEPGCHADTEGGRGGA